MSMIVSDKHPIHPDNMRYLGRCVKIMREAVEKIAKDRQGDVTDSYVDCDGMQHHCLVGLRTERLPRGLGITVASDDMLCIEYDKQAADMAEVEAIRREIMMALTLDIISYANERRWRYS